MSDDARSANELRSSLDREIAKGDEAAMRDVMKSEHGRRFLVSLIESTNALGSPYASTSHDLSYNVGYSDVGRMLHRKLEALEPALFLKMLSERQERLDAAERRIEAWKTGQA